MAIGVRIKSENLSGKTANVVFSPLSGGTSNLGTKTIPFNNITSYPYGNYELYIPEYDYTYSLNVTETLGLNQSYAQLGNISGDTNYSVASLNFNEFTAEVVNLGVDTTYWNINNWYMVTESGYMFIFSNNGDNNRLVLFTDINFNNINQYSATTTSYEYDTLDGRICYFIDNDNGRIIYYNGVSVFEFTFDSNTEQANIQWDWDASSIDNTFIFTIYNSSANLKTAYKALSNGSTIPIGNWDTTLENRYYGLYYPCNYFYELSYLVSDGTLKSVTIYDTSGNEYGFPSIASNMFESWTINWYGNQSFNIVYWSNSDVNVEYQILNFDGENQLTIDRTHPRGTEYQNVNILSDDDYWPSDYDNGGIFIILYSNTGAYFQGGGYEIDYVDIVYKLKGDNNFSSYTFSNELTPNCTFEPYVWMGGYKDFYTYCTTGDSLSIILYIGVDGVKLTQTSENVNDISGVNYNRFGDYASFMFLKNSYTEGYLKIFKYGDIVSSEFFNTGGSWYWSYNYWTFYITDFNNSFYINDQVSGLTEINSYNDSTESYSYFTPSYYKRNSVIVLFNNETNYARVLTKTSLSNEFFLPYYNNDYELRVGRDKFIYVYNDNSNNTRINLYNFDGALLTSVLTTINGWNDVYAGKDRYVVKQTDQDGQKLLTMLSDTGYTQVTIDDDFTSWWNINDYILWD